MRGRGHGNYHNNTKRANTVAIYICINKNIK